nr:EpsG family protein [uncultured Carboxylicivirga sp.]
MIDFIPLDQYIPLFNYMVLLLVIVTSFQGFSGSLFNGNTYKIHNFIGITISIIIILYFGLRPISGYYFGDTSNYAHNFTLLQRGSISIDLGKEWVFNGMTQWFAYSGFNVHQYFLFCAFLYIGFNWLSVVKIFGKHYFVPYLVILSMFLFVSNAVNGIRTGLAVSALMVGMAYCKNIWIVILCTMYAYFTHNSTALVILGGILAWFIKNPKYYLYGWFFSILLSLTVGNAVANLFVSLGIADDRLANYLNAADEFASEFSHTGFRWDFLLYSAMPIVVGAYFIFKKNFKDPHYIWIYNIYLVSNSFWVIVIRAAFSNRFAMLSWFIMPLVLIYPYYKKRFWSNQSEKIGQAILLFYAFTFFYNIMKPLL